MAKSAMKKFENSKADRKSDKKSGTTEGSKADREMDRMELSAKKKKGKK